MLELNHKQKETKKIMPPVLTFLVRMTLSSCSRGHDKEKKTHKERKENAQDIQEIYHFEFNVFGINVKCSCPEHERNLLSRVTTVGRRSQNDW